MHEVAIPYGKSRLTVHVPSTRLRAVLAPGASEKTGTDQMSIVRNAVENPIGTCRLRELAKNAKRVLVITSDHTRPVPSHITMPLLLEEIRKGNPDAEITLLIATGMHRPTTQAELVAKLGEDIVGKERIVVHEAAKEEDMAFFGMLPSGGELWLNRLVKENDLVVSEGFIEPHFFAGFSGGRKSILPGVAAKRTVLYNHNAQFIQSPLARQGNLQGNPIHRDMLYAAEQAKLAFILNVVLDADKRIIAAYAGHREQAHRVGCAACEAMMRVQPVPAKIAVTSNGGYPLDQNVYQCVKGMTAAEACVEEGGAIILCAALGDGHGGEAFYQWFARHRNAEEVSRAIENVPPDRTQADQWEAQILARVLGKAAVWFVTGEENRTLIEQMHMRWAKDADTALQEATDMLGEDASVVVIPDGVGVII